MREIVHRGHTKGGKLFIHHRDMFYSLIREMGDCQLLITVRKLYNKRSLNQNSYLHGVVFPMIYEGMIGVGYRGSELNHERVKGLMKYKFLKKEIVNETTGEVIEIIQGTHELSTVEMMEFIDACVQWAAEYLSIVIPMPGEQTKLEFEKQTHEN